MCDPAQVAVLTKHGVGESESSLSSRHVGKALLFSGFFLQPAPCNVGPRGILTCRGVDTGAACRLQTERAYCFPTLNVEVIVVVLKLHKNKPDSFPSPPVALPPQESPTAPPLSTEHGPSVYRGDVVLFLFWMGCFLLMAGMNMYENVVGLFFRR